MKKLCVFRKISVYLICLIKKIFKLIYNAIPLKKYIYSVIKKVYTPSESIYKHLHFNGVITIKINENHQFKIHHFGFWIENELFWRGFGQSWEKESLKLWVKLAKHSQVIFDIGANTGVYSLVAKTINSNAKIFSFEPEPTFFEILKKNIILNHFDINCYKKAVSNHNGIIEIGDYSGKSETLKVEGITLDEFIMRNNLSKIDLIKIDVEKHEPQVLDGFAKYLPIFKPTILIEILDTEIAENIYNKVCNLGYLYFNIDENGQIRQTITIEKSDYYNYLLCSPKIANEIGLI